MPAAAECRELRVGDGDTADLKFGLVEGNVLLAGLESSRELFSEGESSRDVLGLVLVVWVPVTEARRGILPEPTRNLSCATPILVHSNHCGLQSSKIEKKLHLSMHSLLDKNSCLQRATKASVMSYAKCYFI